MTVNRPPVIVIVGPTGSGKTDLAIRLAHKFRGECIAADSRTVYRGMNIGTAKPQADSCKLQAPSQCSPPPVIVQGIPHHLIEIRNPDQSYSVAEFKTDAERIIAEIAQRGNIPIVVGGTGLYVRALVDNFALPNIPAQAGLRESFAQQSNAQLLALLRRIDPAAARAVDRKNKRRLIRALEVCIFTGQPFSALRTKGAPMFSVLQIGVQRTRVALYRRIDRRIRRMFRDGLVEEVRQLLTRYGPDVESLRGIIYREVIEYLRAQPLSIAGIYDLENRRGLRDLQQRIMYANHRYARHQLMWFRRDTRIRWVRTPQQAEKLVREFIASSGVPPRDPERRRGSPSLSSVS